MTPEEKQDLRRKRLQERYQYESENMRGYELIFPTSRDELNDKYF